MYTSRLLAVPGAICNWITRLLLVAEYARQLGDDPGRQQPLALCPDLATPASQNTPSYRANAANRIFAD
jgi:hypothetical protein